MSAPTWNAKTGRWELFGFPMKTQLPRPAPKLSRRPDSPFEGRTIRRNLPLPTDHPGAVAAAQAVARMR